MVFVCVTETELFPSSASNSREVSSYFDTGLYSSPLTAFQLPPAAVTDAVSTDFVTGTDVKCAVLESSPSVIALLNDKLDSQSKVNCYVPLFVHQFFIVNSFCCSS